MQLSLKKIHASAKTVKFLRMWKQESIFCISKKKQTNAICFELFGQYESEAAPKKAPLLQAPRYLDACDAH